MAHVETEAPSASPSSAGDVSAVTAVGRLRGDDAVSRGLAVASAIIIRLVIVPGAMWLLGRRPVFHDLGVRAWRVLTAYVQGVALAARR